MSLAAQENVAPRRNLLLTRRDGESVDIGDLGTITVVSSRRRGTRLSFRFNPSIAIRRSELAGEQSRKPAA